MRSSKPHVLVTTSWDDGHILDTRLAALLRKYRIAATFYIAPFDREFPQSKLLSKLDIRRLARHFEIGAHTLSHPVLTRCTLAEVDREVQSSKEFLQRVTGKPVRMFCYPRGAHSEQIRHSVKKAGFVAARTTQRHKTTIGRDPFLLPTTIHCYNHASDAHKIAAFAKLRPVATAQFSNWEVLAKAYFDYVLEHGGVFHLWGHSWELDQRHDWERLERVLQYIAKRPGVHYCTNSESLKVKP